MIKYLRKILTIAISVVMVVGITACKDNENTGNIGFIEEEVKKQLDITEYTNVCMDEMKKVKSDNGMLVIKNNSEYDCEIEATITPKDSKGKALREVTESTEIGSGEENAIYFYYPEGFDTFDYALKVEENYMDMAKGVLSHTIEMESDKAIVTFTNSGNKDVRRRGNIVFMSGDEILQREVLMLEDVSKNSSNTIEVPFRGFFGKTYDDVRVYYATYENY